MVPFSFESDVSLFSFPVFSVVEEMVGGVIDHGEERKRFIYRHEGMHIRRRDYVVKPLAFIVAAIHWFNPLVWLAYRSAMKDMELSCDELVLNGLRDVDRKGYASTLLDISVNQNKLGLNSLVAFGESNVKERIKSVLDFRGLSARSKVIGGICFVVLFVVLFSSSRNESRMVEALNENSGHYNVVTTKEDIIKVIDDGDELIVFHLGRYEGVGGPVLIASSIEKHWPGYWLSSSGRD